MNQADALRAEVTRSAVALGAPSETRVVLERPRDPAHGDWYTNVAMTLSKALARKPREIAESLIAGMHLERVGVTNADIAGPGFINFRLDAGFQARGLLQILAHPEQWGLSNAGAGEHVVVEFVSANPTGPLHVGHGRQAALGDAVSTLLEYTGWKVSREFYYNDSGAQIANLALSVQARVRESGGAELLIPEGGYHGEYIREIAERYVVQYPGDSSGHDLDAMRVFAVAALRHEQDLDMQAFGVRFNTYYLESALYSDGNVNKTVDMLKASGHTYEEDGALFLRTTEFGDDKDRVMKKSAAKGGDYTYFVPDVAYHVTKWERGYHRAINVQGADHHSTVTRVRAGLQALEMGIPKGYPDYVLHQMVTVLKGGEEMKISKRAGAYVTVRDLIDEVGRDAVRFFFRDVVNEDRISGLVDRSEVLEVNIWSRRCTADAEGAAGHEIDIHRVPARRRFARHTAHLHAGVLWVHEIVILHADRPGFRVLLLPLLQMQQVLPPVDVAIGQMLPAVVRPASQWVEIAHEIRGIVDGCRPAPNQQSRDRAAQPLVLLGQSRQSPSRQE